MRSARAGWLTPVEVEIYLHRHIPLSAHMGVTVAACNATGVVLHAPLTPNLNHRATVFGGSASAAAILAAWTWLHFALDAAGLPSRLVIQRNTMDYLSPIAGEFDARCAALPAPALEKFTRTLRRHGRARCALAAELSCGGRTVAHFSGSYVAAKSA